MSFFFLSEDQTELVARLDHAEDEVITRTAQVTSVPVEDGADVTDHVRLDPEGGVFSGLLLDDPGDPEDVRQRANSGATLQAIRSASPLDETRASSAYARLHDAMVNRQLLTAVTSAEQLNDVVITRLAGSQRRPGVMQVSGSYRVIRRAATQLVALPKPEAKSQASKSKKKGTVKPKEASEEQKARSGAHALFF